MRVVVVIRADVVGVVVVVAAVDGVELVCPVSDMWVWAQGDSRAALEVRTPHPFRESWRSHTTLVTTVMATQPQLSEEIREPGPVGLLTGCEVSSGRRTVEVLVGTT